MSELHSKDHLTNEEFAACLDGTPLRPELRAHLEKCAQCRIEMQSFQTSIEDFGGAAFDWSRAQPMPSLRPAVLSKRSWSQGVVLQWAVAAMLLIGIGAPVLIHTERQNHSKLVPSAISGTDDSDSQIAQDNAMLKSVNLALGSTEVSPFQQYDLTLASPTRNTSHAKARVQ